ncbi:DUF4834 family protein [Ekhidna sp.]|uniref:DUF4834 family protein n=1 Tax=Ekhidna sp. TaxID=2608089 RepID=UPI0032ECA04A
MLKVIIILILIGYVCYRVTNFIFSGIFRGFTQHQQFGRQEQYQRSSRRARDGNLNIDKVPTGKSNKDKGFSGGEYVDYEEVK